MPRRQPANPGARVLLDARYRIEAAAVGGLSLLARLASVRGRHLAADGVGTLHWALDTRHRRVARENLRLAFGDTLSREEVGRMVLASMRHVAHVAVETLAADRYLAGNVDARVPVEGLEHARAAVARGSGVIMISGHLGNWELLGPMMGRLGLPVAPIVRPLDNPYLEARLAKLRSIAGGRLIDKHAAFRQALAHLRRGGSVGLLIDQRPKQGGIAVPFFGHDAYTTGGPAALAHASAAAVVPCFLVRQPDDTLRLVVEPELPVPRTGDRGADGYRLTADCTAVIERWVRRHPAQWLWTHRRWAVPTHGAEGSRTSRHEQHA